MNRFTIIETPINGLKIVNRTRRGDHRGFLARCFCAEELATAGWDKPVAQINHTLTQKPGTVRGMHYQRAPHAEMKLVSCLRGTVWDVAVDLRPGSATFLQWHAVELSAHNLRALLIPEGFAHGFQTLTEDCELIYLHSAAYAPDADCGLHPQDIRLNIRWPLAISELSARDEKHPILTDSFDGVTP